jgi:hypothetical protein
MHVVESGSKDNQDVCNLYSQENTVSQVKLISSILWFWIIMNVNGSEPERGSVTASYCGGSTRSRGELVDQSL